MNYHSFATVLQHKDLGYACIQVQIGTGHYKLRGGGGGATKREGGGHVKFYPYEKGGGGLSHAEGGGAQHVLG